MAKGHKVVVKDQIQHDIGPDEGGHRQDKTYEIYSTKLMWLINRVFHI